MEGLRFLGFRIWPSIPVYQLSKSCWINLCPNLMPWSPLSLYQCWSWRNLIPQKIKEIIYFSKHNHNAKHYINIKQLSTSFTFLKTQAPDRNKVRCHHSTLFIFLAKPVILLKICHITDRQTKFKSQNKFRWSWWRDKNLVHTFNGGLYKKHTY